MESEEGSSSPSELFLTDSTTSSGEDSTITGLYCNEPEYSYKELISRNLNKNSDKSFDSEK